VIYNVRMEQRFQSFAEFWPFYLAEHSRRATRAFHFAGTSLLFVFLFASAAVRSPIFIAFGIVSAYALAWISHFFIEKNRPATFRHPFFSLIGDFKMYYYIISGKMINELWRLKIPAS
jgi:hypothetical protein